jgi:hypothetical protein
MGTQRHVGVGYNGWVVQSDLFRSIARRILWSIPHEFIEYVDFNVYDRCVRVY